MVSVIVAVANGNVIGGGNALLWHISEDMKMFRRITTGHPVVMGRRTFESLGKPLPGRANVVITRQENFGAGEVRVAHSLVEALAIFPPEEEVFIIGGGEIYRQAMNVADRFYLTRVYADCEGDTFFPDWNPEKWKQVKAEYHERGEKYPYPFEFIVYERLK